MDKKAISEIRKLIKPDSCIARIRGCYVNEEGEVIRELHDSIAAMEKESLEKYCEILRGSMSGKLGRNIFNMEFPLGEELDDGRQKSLLRLAHTKYLILLINGVYDIPAKGSDHMEMEDASDYVYSFLLCCICPVTLMKEGLCYDEEACTFLDRRTDWAVQKPVCGFLFPAFNDRQPDIHSLLYYCRKEDERHDEISADLLGCVLPIPEADQKELFKSMVEQTLGRNCDFQNVKNIGDAVGEIIEQNKDTGEPVQLEKSEIRRLLYENGADQSVLSDFDAAYDEAVGEGVPLMAENLIDTGRLEVKSPSMKISVKSDMADMLKTRVIDGMEYLLIPVVDELEVNGIRILQTKREES